MKIRIILTFDRKKKLNNNGKGVIEYQINYGGQQKYISSKIYVEPKYWDKKRREIKNSHPEATNLNFYLKNKISELEKAELERLNNDSILSVQEIKAILKGEARKRIYNFVKWIEIQIEEENFSERTILNHKTFLNRLKEFDKELTFSQISYETIDKFDKFIKKIKVPNTNKTISPGTIHNYHKFFKKYINKAINYELLTKNPYNKFKVKRPQVYREALTEEELFKIEKLENLDVALTYVKDIFLFACYTGIRFGDIFELSNDNLRKTDKGILLHFETEKTKTKIDLPLYAMFDGKPEKIILKYLRNNETKIFPFKTNQDVNRLLKVIKILAKIEKPLSFHIARHTCLTIIGEHTGNPYLVMKIAGHSDIATSMQYTKNVYKNINEELLKW